MTQPAQLRPGVKAIILHEGKILMVSERINRDGHEVIVHDVPGGGMEEDESMAATLKREVFEEVGLKINIVKPIGGWDFTLTKYGELIRAVCFAFLCTVDGTATIDISHNPAKEDIFEAKWISIQEALDHPDLIVNSDFRKTLENCLFFISK